MADMKSRKGGKAAADTAASRKPVRPFLAGMGVSAAWGAFHLPAALWSLVLCGFAVELLAIAIAVGGVIAAAVEVLLLLGNRIPWILAALSRRA